MQKLLPGTHSYVLFYTVEQSCDLQLHKFKLQLYFLYNVFQCFFFTLDWSVSFDCLLTHIFNNKHSHTNLTILFLTGPSLQLSSSLLLKKHKCIVSTSLQFCGILYPFFCSLTWHVMTDACVSHLTEISNCYISSLLSCYLTGNVYI